MGDLIRIARRSGRLSAAVAILAGAGALAAAPAASAAANPRTFTVDSAGDDANATASSTTCRTAAGSCTFRAAIQAADAATTPATIRFAIPGSGRQQIAPLSPLPAISTPVTIDGYTQPGSAPAKASTPAKILIAVEGPRFNTSITPYPGNALTLTATAAGSRVSGLQIFNWFGLAIHDQASGSQVSGDLIGFTDGADIPRTNIGGIELDGVSHAVVGGSSPADRDVIDGNGVRPGVYDLGGSDNVISGDIIGTDEAGDDLGYYANGDGIRLDGAQRDRVLGNVISGNDLNGVDVTGGDHATIAGNLIGTDPTGEHALGNNSSGITVTDSPYALIGGAGAAARNVVSANGEYGVDLTGASGNARLFGNYIGTDAAGTEHDTGAVFDGTRTFGNLRQGILDSGAPKVQVGAPGAGNVLDNNAFTLEGDPELAQIAITGTGASGAIVQANLLGVTPAGKSVGQPGFGVSAGIVIDQAPGALIGGPRAGDGNVVANMQFIGIGVENVTGGAVQDNIVGTAADGRTAAPDNIFEAGEITLTNDKNVQVGGLRPQPGSPASCALSGACSAAQLALGPANLISAASDYGSPSGSYGLSLDGGSGDVLQGNLVGIDFTGEQPLGNGTCGMVLGDTDHLTIGGAAAGAGNVVSANGLHGIQLSSSTATTIQGNRIGTDAAGLRVLANQGAGLDVLSFSKDTLIGGAAAGAGNVISGNGSNGEGNVLVSGLSGWNAGTVLEGNLIGTDVHGTPLNNPAGGVTVEGGADGTAIGGATSGDGNTIAGNSGPGVLIDVVHGVTVRGNSIFANKSGIVLTHAANAGATAPQLQQLVRGTLSGILSGTPGQTYTVDFYANPGGGDDEGATWLGSQTVTVGSTGSAPVGLASVPAGSRSVTATATDASGNTSPFSAPLTPTH